MSSSTSALPPPTVSAPGYSEGHLKFIPKPEQMPQESPYGSEPPKKKRATPAAKARLSGSPGLTAIQGGVAPPGQAVDIPTMARLFYMLASSSGGTPGAPGSVSGSVPGGPMIDSAGVALGPGTSGRTETTAGTGELESGSIPLGMDSLHQPHPMGAEELVAAAVGAADGGRQLLQSGEHHLQDRFGAAPEGVQHAVHLAEMHQQGGAAAEGAAPTAEQPGEGMAAQVDDQTAPATALEPEVGGMIPPLPAAQAGGLDQQLDLMKLLAALGSGTDQLQVPCSQGGGSLPGQLSHQQQLGHPSTAQPLSSQHPTELQTPEQQHQQQQQMQQVFAALATVASTTPGATTHEQQLNLQQLFASIASVEAMKGGAGGLGLFDDQSPGGGGMQNPGTPNNRNRGRPHRSAAELPPEVQEAMQRRNWWRSRICNKDGSRTSVGYDRDIETAARLYDMAAIKQFGLEATTNYSLSDYPDLVLPLQEAAVASSANNPPSSPPEQVQAGVVLQLEAAPPHSMPPMSSVPEEGNPGPGPITSTPVPLPAPTTGSLSLAGTPMPSQLSSLGPLPSAPYSAPPGVGGEGPPTKRGRGRPHSQPKAIPPEAGVPQLNMFGKSYIGVTWCKDKSKYRARISNRNGTKTSLGYYNNIKDAAHAFDTAAIDRFGPSAATNYPVSMYTGVGGLGILSHAQLPSPQLLPHPSSAGNVSTTPSALDLGYIPPASISANPNHPNHPNHLNHPKAPSATPPQHHGNNSYSMLLADAVQQPGGPSDPMHLGAVADMHQPSNAAPQISHPPQDPMMHQGSAGGGAQDTHPGPSHQLGHAPGLPVLHLDTMPAAAGHMDSAYIAWSNTGGHPGGPSPGHAGLLSEVTASAGLPADNSSHPSALNVHSHTHTHNPNHVIDIALQQLYAGAQPVGLTASQQQLHQHTQLLGQLLQAQGHEQPGGDGAAAASQQHAQLLGQLLQAQAQEQQGGINAGASAAFASHQHAQMLGQLLQAQGQEQPGGDGAAAVSHQHAQLLGQLLQAQAQEQQGGINAGASAAFASHQHAQMLGQLLQAQGQEQPGGDGAAAVSHQHAQLLGQLLQAQAQEQQGGNNAGASAAFASHQHAQMLGQLLQAQGQEQPGEGNLSGASLRGASPAAVSHQHSQLLGQMLQEQEQPGGNTAGEVNLSGAPLREVSPAAAVSHQHAQLLGQLGQLLQGQGQAGVNTTGEVNFSGAPLREANPAAASHQHAQLLTQLLQEQEQPGVSVAGEVNLSATLSQANGLGSSVVGGGGPVPQQHVPPLEAALPTGGGNLAPEHHELVPGHLPSELPSVPMAGPVHQEPVHQEQVHHEQVHQEAVLLQVHQDGPGEAHVAEDVPRVHPQLHVQVMYPRDRGAAGRRVVPPEAVQQHQATVQHQVRDSLSAEERLAAKLRIELKAASDKENLMLTLKKAETEAMQRTLLATQKAADVEKGRVVGSDARVALDKVKDTQGIVGQKIKQRNELQQEVISKVARAVGAESEVSVLRQQVAQATSEMNEQKDLATRLGNEASRLKAEMTEVKLQSSNLFTVIVKEDDEIGFKLQATSAEKRKADAELEAQKALLAKSVSDGVALAASIKESEQRIVDLEAELLSQGTTSRDLAAKMGEVREEVTTLASNLASGKKTNSAAKAQVASLRAELLELQSDVPVALLRAELLKLQSELNKNTKKLNQELGLKASMERSLVAVSEELKMTMVASEREKSLAAALQRQSQIRQQQVSEEKSSNSALKKQMDALDESTNQKLQLAIDKLGKAVQVQAQAEAKSKELADEVEVTKKKLRAVVDKLGKVVQMQAEAEEKSKELAEEVEIAKEKEVALVVETISRLQVVVGKLGKAVQAKAEAKYKELAEELKVIEATTNKSMDTAEALSHQFRQDITSLQVIEAATNKSMGTAEALSHQYRQEVADSKALVQRLEEVAQLKAIEAAVNKSMDTAEALSHQYQQEVADSKAQVQRLEEVAQVLKVIEAAADKSTDMAEALSEQYRQEVADSKAQVQRLEKVAQVAGAEDEAMGAKLAEMGGHVEKLRQQVADIVKSSATSAGDLMTEQRKRGMVEADLEELSEQLDVIMSRKAGAKSEAEADLKQLKGLFENLKNRVEAKSAAADKVAGSSAAGQAKPKEADAKPEVAGSSAPDQAKPKVAASGPLGGAKRKEQAEADRKELKGSFENLKNRVKRESIEANKVAGQAKLKNTEAKPKVKTAPVAPKRSDAM
eukprot:gene6238-2858_t